jgi:hypothetical protein
MRTKIEYSVDLKNVPREVKEKLLEISDSLDALSKYSFALSEDLELDSLGPILRRADSLRKKLFQVDSSLEDCMRALANYGDTITQLQQEQAAQQAPPAPPEEAGDDA